MKGSSARPSPDAKGHTLVCTIIELTEKYIDYSRVYDEASFYDTSDNEKLAESFWESSAHIKALRRKAQRNDQRHRLGDSLRR